MGKQREGANMGHLILHDINRFKYFLISMVVIPLLGNSSFSDNFAAWLGLTGLLLVFSIIAAANFSILIGS